MVRISLRPIHSIAVGGVIQVVLTLYIGGNITKADIQHSLRGLLNTTFQGTATLVKDKLYAPY